MSLRQTFSLAVILTIFAFGSQADAREYQLLNLDFGSVVIGDSSTQMVVELTNNSEMSLQVNCHFWNPTFGLDKYTASSFRVWTPTISLVPNAMLEIHAAEERYFGEHNFEPRTFEELIDSGYYEIPDAIEDLWNFRFIGSNPITTLIAENIAEPSHILTYNLSTGNMIGWGVTETIFNMQTGGRWPLNLICQPDKEGELIDTILYDIGPVGEEPTLFYACALRANGVVAVEEEKLDVPIEFSLAAPYPNPFNSTTSISYTLPERAWSQLTVFNAMGEEVAVLRNGISPAGEQRILWNATGLPSGVYYPTLILNGQSKSVRAVFVR